MFAIRFITLYKNPSQDYKHSVICRGFEEAGTMSPLTEKSGDIVKKLGTFSHHFLKVPIAAN